MKRLFLLLAMLSLVALIGCGGGGGGGDVIPGSLQVINESDLRIDELYMARPPWEFDLFDPFNNKLPSPILPDGDITLDDIPAGTYTVMVVHRDQASNPYNVIFNGVTIVGRQTTQITVLAGSFSGTLHVINSSADPIKEVLINGQNRLPFGPIEPTKSISFFGLEPRSYKVELVQEGREPKSYDVVIESVKITTIDHTI